MPGHRSDRSHSYGARSAAALALVASALVTTGSLATPGPAADRDAAQPTTTTTLIITAPPSRADRLRRTKHVDPAEMRFMLHPAGPGTGYRLERSDTVSATL